MKLLVLLAVVAGLWWLRRLAQAGRPRHPVQRVRPVPQPMLRCQVCGTQVPAAECLQDAGGAYCCVAHQQQAQAALRRTEERKA